MRFLCGCPIYRAIRHLHPPTTSDCPSLLLFHLPHRRSWLFTLCSGAGVLLIAGVFVNRAATAHLYAQSDGVFRLLVGSPITGIASSKQPAPKNCICGSRCAAVTHVLCTRTIPHNAWLPTRYYNTGTAETHTDAAGECNPPTKGVLLLPRHLVVRSPGVVGDIVNQQVVVVLVTEPVRHGAVVFPLEDKEAVVKRLLQRPETYGNKSWQHAPKV